MKRIHLLVGVLILAGLLIPFRAQIRAALRGKSMRRYSVAERQQQYGPAVRARMQPYFQHAHVTYPPAQLVLVGLKRECELQMYAADHPGQLRYIRGYCILAASGGPGPKQREGDEQVPEGIYRVASLNPNSAFHLALRVGYPNAFDEEMAKRDGRAKLGGDIMIHGSFVSAGCLAMGDQASEDLFILAADTGVNNIEVILSPLDFRTQHLPKKALAKMPEWTDGLYARIKERLVQLPVPE